jgi:pyruvate formate lyase activating enzyme
MSTKASIKGFIKNSFLDWDGKIVSVLFLPACNFRCKFCHNWKLVTEPDTMPDVLTDEIFCYLTEHLDFLDGVCITGGEPCIQKDSLFSLLPEIRKMGLKIKIDTNGSMPEVLEDLMHLGYVDYIAMDIKTELNQQKYSDLCGTDVNLEMLRKSICLIKNFGNYEFRTTYIPGIHKPETIQKILLELEMPKKYVLQRFIPENAYSPELRKLQKADIEELNKIASMYSSLAHHISVR